MCTLEYNQQKNLVLFAVPCFSQAQNSGNNMLHQNRLSLQHAMWADLSLMACSCSWHRTSLSEKCQRLVLSSSSQMFYLQLPGCDVRWLAPVPDRVHPFQRNPPPHNPRRALFVSWGLAHSGWNCASGCCSPCCSWDCCWRRSSSGTRHSAGSTLSEDSDQLEGWLLASCLTQGQECSLRFLFCLHCCSKCSS